MGRPRGPLGGVEFLNVKRLFFVAQNDGIRHFEWIPHVERRNCGFRVKWRNIRNIINNKDNKNIKELKILAVPAAAGPKSWLPGPNSKD